MDRYSDEENKKSVKLKLPDDIPEELKMFVVEEKGKYYRISEYFIDTQKYFYLFVQEFYKIIDSRCIYRYSLTILKLGLR